MDTVQINCVALSAVHHYISSTIHHVRINMQDGCLSLPYIHWKCFVFNKVTIKCNFLGGIPEEVQHTHVSSYYV